MEFKRKVSKGDSRGFPIFNPVIQTQNLVQPRNPDGYFSFNPKYRPDFASKCRNPSFKEGKSYTVDHHSSLRGTGLKGKERKNARERMKWKGSVHFSSLALLHPSHAPLSVSLKPSPFLFRAHFLPLSLESPSSLAPTPSFPLFLSLTTPAKQG